MAGEIASAAVIDAVRQFDAAAGAGQLTAVLGSAVRAANKRIAARAERSRHWPAWVRR